MAKLQERNNDEDGWNWTVGFDDILASIAAWKSVLNRTDNAHHRESGLDRREPPWSKEGTGESRRPTLAQTWIGVRGVAPRCAVAGKQVSADLIHVVFGDFRLHARSCLESRFKLHAYSG